LFFVKKLGDAYDFVIYYEIIMDVKFLPSQSKLGISEVGFSYTKEIVGGVFALSQSHSENTTREIFWRIFISEQLGGEHEQREIQVRHPQIRDQALTAPLLSWVPHILKSTAVVT